MYQYFLCLKYLLGRPLNLLGAIGVTIAIWAMVLVGSVFSGFIREVRTMVRGGFPALALLDDSLAVSYAKVEEALRDDPDVVAMAPRIVWHGLLYFEGGRVRRQHVRVGAEQDSTSYYAIVGVDWDKERVTGELVRWLQDVPDDERRARDLAHPFRVTAQDAGGDRAAPGMVLGFQRSRYDREGSTIRRGQKIVVCWARTQGETPIGVKQDFRLSGTFWAGRLKEVESSTVFVEIEELRTFLGHDAGNQDSIDVFNEVTIKVRTETDLPAIAARLDKKLAAAGLPGRVFTWEDRQARFLSAVEIERAVMRLVLFALTVVACFLIFATVSMLVARKTRDIGILAALGATRRGVRHIFLLCGAAIAGLGTLVGLVLGVLSCRWLNPVNDWLSSRFGVSMFPKEIYGLPEIPYDLTAAWLTVVAGSAIAIALLFSLLPAWRASRLDPVQALRYE